MKALWLGRVDYASAWQLQRELHAMRVEQQIEDILLLLEHPPTVTLGRAANPAHLLHAPERLREVGITVSETDRGGDVTYHGPGQLVGYPIFDLRGHGRDIHGFLRDIEVAILAALAEIGIQARRFPPHTGVWVEERKIAAIGVKVSRWVSMHGFALNVMPDMSHFSLIVPCGLSDYGVTSVQMELGRPTELLRVIRPVAAAFRSVFGAGESGEPIPVAELTSGSRRILESALDLC